MSRTARPTRLHVLAEFRHQLRMFLQFSEAAAARAGLEPQQHQLLLQIAGAPPHTPTTVGYVAERLGLRHNSAVELSKRAAELGLLTRNALPADRRVVLLALTPLGRDLLDGLSAEHAQELNQRAPALIHTLSLLTTATTSRRKTHTPGEHDEA